MTTEVLSGLKVIELASVLAGPSVGQFLAELGADVIKIENVKTAGDVTRSWLSKGEDPLPGRVSAYFSSVNWGKKSMALDLTQNAGQEILQALVADCEVVISSYKPGDDLKLKADYETFKQVNDQIIYAQVTGYGDDNKKTGYDAIIQAESGFMSMNGEPGGPFLKMPVALVDVLAAHHLKEGILLALLNKERNGGGEYVQVSLFDAAVASLANQAANWLVAGKIPHQMGQEHPNIAPYGKTFKTSDGKQLILAVGTDNQFQKLCQVLDIPELGRSDKYATNPLRVQNRDDLNAALETAISQFPSHQLILQLERASIPAGLVNTIDQVFERAETSRMLMQTDGTSTALSGVRNAAFTIGDQERVPQLSPPPMFGQHTREILHLRLDLTDAQMEDLEQNNVIKTL